MRNKLFVTPLFSKIRETLASILQQLKSFIYPKKKKLGILPAYGSPSGGNIRYPSLKKILASAEDL